MGSIGQAGSYLTFYNWVKGGATWDIKLEKRWQSTIGTTFPGVETQVMYNGMIMTPEQLGNYIYGYLGASFGFSLTILRYGSFYATGHYGMNASQLYDELYNDWEMISAGYRAYR